MSLEDPRWGPADSDASSAHPIANEACAGQALGSEVRFAGGRIDALVLCEGAVLRTSAPDAVHTGIAQVRRLIRADPLHIVHVVFAPDVPRPLLLGLVRLENRDRRPLKLEYSELWGVEGSDYLTGPGACSCQTSQGTRALGDASSGVRARAPESPPRLGLSLELPLVLPPGARRELSFAYAAPAPGEGPELLVRAWRGEIAAELERGVARWLERLRDEAEPVLAYRNRVGPPH